MQTLDIWIGDKFFQVHPDHILGFETTKSGRFGPVTVTEGNMKNVEDGIKVPEVHQQPFVPGGTLGDPMASHGGLSPVTDTQVSDDSNGAIDEAIKKTESFKHPPSDASIDLIQMDELIAKWNPKVTRDEIEIWLWYQLGRTFDKSQVLKSSNSWSKYVIPASQIEEKKKVWIEKGLLCYDGKEYLPDVLFYGGNIYTRIDLVKLNEKTIRATIGDAAYESQLKKLINAIPQKLRILAPQTERLYISPVDPFCKKVYIDTLADGTVCDEGATLYSAFGDWLRDVPKGEYKNRSNYTDVWTVYIQGGRMPGAKDLTEAQKLARKRSAQMDALALFQKFLYEMISRDDQQLIEHQWNGTFNNWKEYDYERIPIGMAINRWYKAGPFEILPAQLEGVKFLSTNGSGLVAYDVGVGKTITAILCLAQAMYTGQCKRPLVVVPNGVYEKWITDTVGAWNEDGTCKIHGVLPQYKDSVNDYYNLGVDYEHLVVDKPPKDYTITFITYQGLMKLGFSKRLQDELGDEFFDILNQGGLEGKDITKLKEKVDELLGKTTAETIADVDTLGFDYIVIDEAHNMKKVFTMVKGHADDKDENDDEEVMVAKRSSKKSYYELNSGTPSAQGLKSFMICNYIQRRHSGGNTCLLTATPFTNSPLEVYSMLAMVGYNGLQKRGISNITTFFDKFVNQTYQAVWTAKGHYELKPVVKSFNNKIVLQSVIYSYMIYKTGEEANVPRPIKIVYPYLKDRNGIILTPDRRVETALPATPDQIHWLKEIADFAAGMPNEIESYLGDQYYDEDDKIPGRILLAISFARQLTISPYLFKIYDSNDEPQHVIYDEEPNYLDYIENSPKLQYTMECIKTVKQWHESRNEDVSGQVIHMGEGVDYFPLIKEYLVQKLKFAEKEVEIISGDVSGDKRERIKEAFLKGNVKIILGSDAILEGVDLQTKTTVMYELTLPWNPTALIQFEGRGWRQGNIHSHIRIVIPLIENSIDVFFFQKLEEKTARINDIWYRAGRSNVLNIEELDPNELKLGLITDPDARARAEVNGEIELVDQEMQLINDNIQSLERAKKTIDDYNNAQDEIDVHFQEAKKSLLASVNSLRMWLQDGIRYDTKADRTNDENKLERITKILVNVGALPAASLSTESKTGLSEEEEEQTEIDPEKARYAAIKYYAREMIKLKGGWSTYHQRLITDCDSQIKRAHEIEQVQKNILIPNGLIITDDLEPLINDFHKQFAAQQEKKEQLDSDDHRSSVAARYRAEMEEKQKGSTSVMERVKEFTKHNHLLSCLKAVHDCDLVPPEVKTCMGDCDHTKPAAADVIAEEGSPNLPGGAVEEEKIIPELHTVEEIETAINTRVDAHETFDFSEMEIPFAKTGKVKQDYRCLRKGKEWKVYRRKEREDDGLKSALIDIAWEKEPDLVTKSDSKLKKFVREKLILQQPVVTAIVNNDLSELEELELAEAEAEALLLKFKFAA